MSSYIIRDTDPALWKKVKLLALKQDLSVKALIEQLLRAAVQNQ